MTTRPTDLLTPHTRLIRSPTSGHVDLAGHGWKVSVNTIAGPQCAPTAWSYGLQCKRRGLTRAGRNSAKVPDALNRNHNQVCPLRAL